MLLACYLKARDHARWGPVKAAPAPGEASRPRADGPCESAASSSSGRRDTEEAAAALALAAPPRGDPADCPPLSSATDGGQAADAASEPLRAFEDGGAAEPDGGAFPDGGPEPQGAGAPRLTDRERAELLELRARSSHLEEGARDAGAEIASLKLALRLRDRQAADLVKMHLEERAARSAARREEADGGASAGGSVGDAGGVPEGPASSSSTATPALSWDRPGRCGRSTPAAARGPGGAPAAASALRGPAKRPAAASPPEPTAHSRASPPAAPETPSAVSGRTTPSSSREVVATLSSEISSYQSRLRRLEAERKATQRRIRDDELAAAEERRAAAAAHAQMSQALKAIEATACTLKLQLDASRVENGRLREDADASRTKLRQVIAELEGKLSYYSETVHSHANKRAELENALLQRTSELRAAHAALGSMRERLARAEGDGPPPPSSRGALEHMKAASIRTRASRRALAAAAPMTRSPASECHTS